MANSILSLIFPMSGQDCIYSHEHSQETKKEAVTIPLSAKKLFSNATKFRKRIGLLIPSNFDVRVQQRCLLFQAALTAASSGKAVVIVTSQRWTELPMNVDADNGVHLMSNMSVGIVQRLNFVYPKTASELFLYISALGRSNEIPDLILFENVDNFFPTHERQPKEQCPVSKFLQKLFSSLVNLSNGLADKKLFDILITSSKRDNFLHPDHFYLWLDEIWEMAKVDHSNEYELDFVDEASPVAFKLKFAFESRNNQYFFESFSRESKSDLSSPIL